jgi:hypothetical protein
LEWGELVLVTGLAALEWGRLALVVQDWGKLALVWDWEMVWEEG